MLTDLKNKQTAFIEMRDELLELTKEKNGELYDAINAKLTTHFEQDSFVLLLSLSGGILSENWEPVMGFERIGSIDYHELYHSGINLLEEYPDEIDWTLLFQVCEEIENEFGIKVKLPKNK